jgi:hypothetical protein
MLSMLVDGWFKVECYSFAAQKAVCLKTTRFHSNYDERQCVPADVLVRFDCSFQIRSPRDEYASLTLLCLYFQNFFYSEFKQVKF